MFAFDPKEIHKIIDRASTIKLNGSIFNTVFHCLSILIIGIVSALCLAEHSILCGIILGSIIGLFLVAFCGLLWFANKQPYIAVFNGGQLLLHERMIHTKNKTDLVESMETEDTPVPLLSDVNTPESEVVHG